MGLYDRDYMRRPVADEPGEHSGQSRLPTRKRLLIVIGVGLLVTAMIAALF